MYKYIIYANILLASAQLHCQWLENSEKFFGKASNNILSLPKSPFIATQII